MKNILCFVVIFTSSFGIGSCQIDEYNNPDSAVYSKNKVNSIIVFLMNEDEKYLPENEIILNRDGLVEKILIINDDSSKTLICSNTYSGHKIQLRNLYRNDTTMIKYQYKNDKLAYVQYLKGEMSFYYYEYELNKPRKIKYIKEKVHSIYSTYNNHGKLIQELYLNNIGDTINIKTFNIVFFPEKNETVTTEYCNGFIQSISYETPYYKEVRNTSREDTLEQSYTIENYDTFGNKIISQLISMEYENNVLIENNSTYLFKYDKQKRLIETLAINNDFEIFRHIVIKRNEKGLITDSNDRFGHRFRYEYKYDK